MANRQITIDLEARTGRYTSGLQRAQRSTSQFGGSLQSAAKSAAMLGGVAVVAGIAALGAAIVKVGVESATAFASFEKSLSQIEGLVGVAHEEVVGFQDTILELSNATARPAQELAEALFFITSAGLEGADALDALEASAQAAAAGLGDTAVVADVVTSAMNAYGPATLSAAQATDVLVASVREGKAAAPELAGALGQVIPIASSMGVRFDEVGAAIAAMTRTGLSAAEASTALKSIMTSIISPTTDATKALSEMGLSAQGLQAQIKTDGLFQTLQTLTTAFDGNTEATARVFGNVRALTGIMSLMGSNAAATEQIFAELADATGALDHAFGVVSETGAFAMEQARESINNTMLEVGRDLLPQLADAIQQMAPHIGELVKGLGDLAIVGVDFASAAIPAVVDGFAILEKTVINSQIAVQKLRSGWGDFVDVMDVLGGPLLNYGDAFDEVQEDHLQWLKAQRQVIEVMRQTGDPIHAATNAMLLLADQTAINEERTAALADQLGLTDRELLDATQYAYDYAEANGASEAKLGSLTIAIAYLEDALADENRAQAIAAGQARLTAEANFYAAKSAAEAAKVIEDDYVPSLTELEQALADAEAAQESLSGALKEAANPALKAISAVDKLRDAEQKLVEVQEDEKASAADLAQAQIDIVTATLDAQTALDALDGQALEAVLMAITESLGLSDDEANDLLETLGILNGTSVTTVVNIETVETRTRREARYRKLGEVEGLDFGGGGIVPGPLGMPQVATVHGGERIQTVEEQRSQTTNEGGRTVQLTIISPETRDLAGDISAGLTRASVIEQVDLIGGW